MFDYTKTIINAVKAFFVSELGKVRSGLEKLVSAAQTTANSAKSTAESAQNTAENAQNTAENAQNTAETAQAEANNQNKTNWDNFTVGDKSSVNFFRVFLNKNSSASSSIKLSHRPLNGVNTNTVEIDSDGYVGISTKLLKFTSFTGNEAFSTRVQGVATPENTHDAANKKYVDDAVALTQNEALLKSGGTMNGSLILSGAPTVPNEAVTKEYADVIKTMAQNSAERLKVFPATIKQLEINVPGETENLSTVTGTKDDGTSETYYYLPNIYIPYAAHFGGVHCISNSEGFQLSDCDSYTGLDAGFFAYRHHSDNIPVFVSVFNGWIAGSKTCGVTFGNLTNGFYVHSSVSRILFDATFVPLNQQLILLSSTHGSAKRFRITVDDSGTLSATEVTS